MGWIEVVEEEEEEEVQITDVFCILHSKLKKKHCKWEGM